MSEFSRHLLVWQGEFGRHNLPWQAGTDPYPIWLSEIMLQQTQVATVIPYFLRFRERFPDIASLAAAPVDEVLGLWSGLGYYARGRNLHKAARQIMERHGGVFPRQMQDIANLPGIGRSTAAAISAFAWGERSAILDGNVKRVLTRCFGIEGFPGEKAVETRLWALAESLLPETGMAAYTQGLMDLGATLCTRSRPACDRCPMAASCVALREGRVAELPTRKPKKERPFRQETVLILLAEGRILLERRPPAGIWGGLLALPVLPEGCNDPLVWIAQELGMQIETLRPLPPVTHDFTHFRLEMRPLLGQAASHRPGVRQDNATWLPLTQLDGAPLPAPVRRLLQSLA